MELYPSIDLLNGKVVRLLRGDYDAETVYSNDPVAIAEGFAAAGAHWIHVVDLDAARAGGDANLESIERICVSVGANVQTGGGVRSVADAEQRFAAGAARVVIGSAAVEHPDIVDELASLHPNQVAVGLDARGRDVAIHGWEDATGRDLVALAMSFEGRGVSALVVTDISQDGTLAGPGVEQLGAVTEAVRVPVIASGGVGTISDLMKLAALPVAGAIVGRALYEGRFTVEEAIAACSQSA
jgi:phosphoribosylformimino-5-aminoimidazole carboxamide ribotide isomerase